MIKLHLGWLNEAMTASLCLLWGILILGVYLLWFIVWVFVYVGLYIYDIVYLGCAQHASLQ